MSDTPNAGAYRRRPQQLERYPKRPADGSLPPELELLDTEDGFKWQFRDVGLRVEVDGDEFVPESIGSREGYVVLRRAADREGMINASDEREVRIYADMGADLIATGGDDDC